jgi:uncharacterized protein YbjT (DUF2867 family)
VLSQPPDRHHGRVYTPTGPRAISFAEMAATLGTVLGRPVDYRPVSDDEARAEMLGAGVPGWIAGMLVEYGRAYAAGGATSPRTTSPRWRDGPRGTSPPSPASTPARSARRPGYQRR